MTKPSYLSKSRFKLALECPTKLHYKVPANGYFDKNQGNDFLQALADGGHQVGELAKYKYHPNPVGDGITVETLAHAQAVAQTHAMLERPGRVVIAEAALLSAPYFVRVDILIQDKDAKTIDLIEVKSKSVTSDDVASRFKGASGKYEANWLPYLYDVTFQAEVARLVFPGYVIRPKLLLVDSERVCEQDGLHQLFKVVEMKTQDGRSRVHVQTPHQLTKAELGQMDYLREVDVSDVVADLCARPIDNVAHVPEQYRENLKTFMQWAGDLQTSGAKHFHGVSKACRTCQFRAPEGSDQKSGVHECWQMAISQGLLQGGRSLHDRTIPLSIDLWGGATGAKSLADLVIAQGRAFLEDIQPEDLQAKGTSKDLAGC